MIRIICNDDSFRYDIFSLIQAFYPKEDIVFAGDKRDVLSTDIDPLNITVDFSDTNVSVAINGRDRQSSSPLTSERKENKNILKRLLYNVLTKETNHELPWGTLTGIRPTKLSMGMVRERSSSKEIIDYLKKEYLVSDKKARLSMEIAKRENGILAPIADNSFSLYIGIPFCPSICAYCSFSSSPIGLWKDKVDTYLDVLCKELSYVAEVSKDHILSSVYIGGGTPTTLNESQLSRLLSFINDKFNLNNLLEYTLEAGRPDSITASKLKIIREHGVGRISVNPQSFNQKTLDRIGRRHSVEEVERAAVLVKECEFPVMNMDLILGLSGENNEDFMYSLKRALSFDPENITVHSLSIKRASKLKTDDDYNGLDEYNIIDGQALMDNAINLLDDNKLYPYYLYRQKQIAENLENIGFSKEKNEGLYNILIMEEAHPIIACGAGAASKYVTEFGRKPLRSENVKDIDAYISRIDEMIDRKKDKLEEIQWL